MLDADPAAGPGTAPDTDAPQEIQTLTTELEDTTSGAKETPQVEPEMLRASTLLYQWQLEWIIHLFFRRRRAPWREEDEEEEELHQTHLVDEEDI